jgi:hypothetical protein
MIGVSLIGCTLARLNLQELSFRMSATLFIRDVLWTLAAVVAHDCGPFTRSA